LRHGCSSWFRFDAFVLHAWEGSLLSGSNVRYLPRS
jgi:hypothetical protein